MTAYLGRIYRLPARILSRVVMSAANIALLSPPIIHHQPPATQVGAKGWNPAKEDYLVLGSAKIMARVDRAGSLSLEIAESIVRANRQKSEPVLYTGAGTYESKDFLATGAKRAVFVDKGDYIPEIRERIVRGLWESLQEFGAADFTLVHNGKERFVFRFKFYGEEKEIACYSGDLDSLFYSFSPIELEGGISHLISLHRPCNPSHISPNLLAKVVIGGHVEGMLGLDSHLLENLLGLQLLHGKPSTAGYNKYRKLKHVDFTRGAVPCFVDNASEIVIRIDCLLERKPYKVEDPNYSLDKLERKGFKVLPGQDPIEVELEYDLFRLVKGFNGLRKNFDEMNEGERSIALSYFKTRLFSAGVYRERIDRGLLLYFPELFEEEEANTLADAYKEACVLRKTRDRLAGGQNDFDGVTLGEAERYFFRIASLVDNPRLSEDGQGRVRALLWATIKDRPRFKSRLFDLFIENEKYEELGLLIKLSFEEEPNNPQNRYILAACLFNLGRFQEALDQINRALEIEPDNPTFKETRAEILQSILA
ncbi:hypothetical protein A2276_00170 [candidate division WOR-1 bacterium RIFOXYA12_FULL_43_27]|uniref:Uncharacterized protein n=1 Tax=candidate division WOR-1 bacterium RIFOXYC2_FULL_46_14 TaxID=1802587 RepID=A0A1F4U4F8_UNCSA|nr:MAG: hypothetical protein A2276_00170 [candidate division WOR-1 bacterium RIFOXYA12_FULL_43_27]OGC20887.1 MAG: hypothetical protein A2292_07705 [candidate division WOR-1 bacterium RIFOXYB2_FULL_46_45]OGC31375.1 MAG: hypothetical protein A2232_03740 [candidate division WOR-1 bacterium RIFOXYA2_FULL_46_56]OGC39781.1 MAG: hypothetical protein A2438_04575 [candidate division WOR-1 bacterium RIFOXYC2_FULL_46_14]